jgi:hypothetical protein
MAGRRHQFILGLVIRQMRGHGFSVFYADGKFAGGFGQETPIPPQIMRHRPDAVGISHEGVLCIGEAKTETDIQTNRTREQVQDFTAFSFNGQPCQVIIGVPKSAEEATRRMLVRLSIEGRPNLQILYVPEEIING